MASAFLDLMVIFESHFTCDGVGYCGMVLDRTNTTRLTWQLSIETLQK
jgi:hypothetical protein